jgi:diguanylate cyclase (GGDEF)-like protein
MTSVSAATSCTRSSRTTARPRDLRDGAVRSTLGPALSVVYLLATWGGPHRPVMLATAVGMLAAAGLTWAAAAPIVRSRARVAVENAVCVVTIAGLTVLSLLDGGIASPLGPLVPFALIFFAIAVPRRVFPAVCVLSAAAYWTVALVGAPARPGYAFVYTFTAGGIAYVCMRHAAALRRLRRHLAEVSRVDALTGCLNRRGFDEQLAAELAEAARTGESLTLILIDLDRFKEVNDTYGHQAGDDLLARVGRTLTEQSRGHDAVGRVGGDEFAMVLADTGPDGARVVEERLRATLGTVAPASLGHACYPVDGTTADELKRLADQRAYQDKLGRDRTAPTRRTVAEATAQAGHRKPVEGPALARRRRSITDLGWASAWSGAVGIAYAAMFAGDASNRTWIGALCALGLVDGLLVVAAAAWLSRCAAVWLLMLANALFLFFLTTTAAVLDGGVGSAAGIVMLGPMALIALGTPARVALPVMAAASALYLGVGLVVGAPGGWYIVVHLAGIIGVSAACARLGRAAARQRSLLTRLSRVDVLTDSLNRRGFEERCAAELAHARRSHRATALLTFDLDGFKQLNDTKGHAAGDDLLRWVATALRQHVHPHDVVGRLGGDEFVVLLTSGSATAVAATAERLRAVLAERTPASVGCAVLDEHGGDFAALYAHADAALYADKAPRRRAAGPSRTRAEPANRPAVTHPGPRPVGLDVRPGQ